MTAPKCPRAEWRCRQCGFGEFRWYRTVTKTRGPMRKRVCSTCVRPSLKGRSYCPKCHGTEFRLRNRADRPPTRECATCFRRRQRVYLRWLGSDKRDECEDPWAENCAALDRALGR